MLTGHNPSGAALALAAVALLSACGMAPASPAARALAARGDVAQAAPLARPLGLTLDAKVFDNRALAPVLSVPLTSLAYAVQYEPVKALRAPIAERIGRPLKFFTGYDPAGEAHVTVVTPPEFANTLQTHLTLEEIGEIARRERIQDADLAIDGVGSGRAVLNGREEETFFLIVRSKRLVEVRRAIHAAFVAKGGDPKAWDPDHFYSHVTIGYTERDLHESDGVIKDKAHALDPRFKLKIAH